MIIVKQTLSMSYTELLNLLVQFPLDKNLSDFDGQKVAIKLVNHEGTQVVNTNDRLVLEFEN